MSSSWCSAMAIDHTFMDPIANPMPVRETKSSTRPGLVSRGPGPPSVLVGCAGRQRREGGALATVAVPTRPRAAVTARARDGLCAEASAAASRGPTMYSRPCVPVSRASAACRSRRLGSTLGHSARSPASRGGVVRPAATTTAVASAGLTWIPTTGRATSSAELSTAAGRCTAVCPRRSIRRPLTGWDSAEDSPYRALSSPPKAMLPPVAVAHRRMATGAMPLGRRPVRVPPRRRATYGLPSTAP